MRTRRDHGDARAGFTLVETLIAVGLLASITSVAASLLTSGLSGIRASCDQLEDTREATRLLDRFSVDAHGASALAAPDSTQLIVTQSGADVVRYTTAATPSALEIWREVRAGAAWTFDPKRPVASFRLRPSEPAPEVAFTAPAAGRTSVRIETERVLVEETIYARLD